MSQNANKFNRVRVNDILEVGRHNVLWQIFVWGTPNKADTTPLDQYLPNQPRNKKGKLVPVSDIFNAGERRKISDDPTCSSFDISLLWKAIKLACDGVANYNDEAWYTPSTTMEYFVTVLKDERNNSMHGKRKITTQDFLDTATRLRQLFCDALSAAKIRYTRSDAEFDPKIKEVYQKCDEIIREVLGEEDLLTFRGPELKQDLIKETNEALKKYLEASRNIDPMSFLTGTKLRLQIQKVFTEVEVTRGRVRGEGQSLRYQDLVEAARSGPSPTQPQVLLVKGVAGSGKTTFATLVTDEWLKDTTDRTITGLDYYDLLLRVQCRERKITSLSGLLENEVPQVFLKFRNLVLSLIKNCKILITIDGLDECNEDSKELIDDILTRMKTANGCTLLFTSRPEGVTSFDSRIPREYEVSYIYLIGIPELHREHFVRRYHEEIKQQTGNTEDTEKLLENVRQVLQKEHFRLPLNMVFLTWVYIHDPSAITSTTTQTQLYHSTYQLCIQKLLDRLARHSTTRSSDRQTLEARLKEPMAQVQYQSLLALWRSRLTFEGQAVENIKDSCTDQGIPQNELLSAFFTLKANRTHLGAIYEQYSAPHKGLQDFYAALHVANKLTTSPASVRGVLEEALGKLDEKLHLLQNVLYHVAGLLHLPPNTVLPKITEEVVDMLHESGMDNKEEWLNLVEDTRVNAAVVRRVAPYFANDRLTKLINNMKEEEEEGQDGKMEEEEDENEEYREEMEEKKMETGKEEEKLKVEEGKNNKKKEVENRQKKTTKENDGDTDDRNPPFPTFISPVYITDTHHESLSALLPHLPPCDVTLTLYKEPGPRMGDLLNALDHNIFIYLDLHHHYEDPDPTTSSDQILQQVLQLPRNRLQRFTGHLTEDGIRRLPRDLRTCCLVLTDDDHAARSLTALHSVYHRLPHLFELGIHVAVGKVTPSSLTTALPDDSGDQGPSSLIPPLPDGSDDNIRESRCGLGTGELSPQPGDARVRKVSVSLRLSGVTDKLIEEACLVAKALQYHDGYWEIMFSRLSASYEGCEKLLEGLAEAGVRVGHYVIIPRDYQKDKMAADRLRTLAIDRLGCELSMYEI